MRRRSTAGYTALALALACATTATPRPNAPVDTFVTSSVQAIPSEKALARVEQTGSGLTLRGWPFFGQPLGRFGVGAPKPGVKVPEFTSGTGRGRSPL